MSITRIQVRRGLASQWADPGTVILAAGEFGLETDTNNFKIGDGLKTWNQLSYFKNVEKLNNVSENNLSNYAKTSQLADYILSSKIGGANGVASLDSNGQVPIEQLQAIISGADESLNTLNEIAQALSDDETGLDAILTEIDKKLPKTGGTISGNLIVENGSNNTVGQVTANRLRVLSSSDISDFSTDHAFQIGLDNQAKLKVNSSKIQAFSSSNNEPSQLQIQPIGGQASFGAGGITTTGKVEVTGSGNFKGSGEELTDIPNSATTATASSSENSIVLRDENQDFSARNITSNSTLLTPSRYLSLKQNRVLTSNTSFQSVFGQATTLEANKTYEIELLISYTKSSTSSTTSVQLSRASGITLSANSTINSEFLNIAAAANSTSITPLNRWELLTGIQQSYRVNSSAVTTLGANIKIKGTIHTALGGVLDPAISFSSNSSPTILSGSYIKITDVFTGQTGVWQLST